MMNVSQRRIYQPGSPTDVSALFQPDAVLPAQWDERYRSGALSPEQMLLRAILCDALQCLQRNREHPERTEYREALQWIVGRTDEDDYVCSFESICETFHLNAAAVRSAALSGGYRSTRSQHRPRQTDFISRHYRMRERV